MAGQSFELTQFYQAYQAWMNSGANSTHIFRRNSGLCCSLARWCKGKEYDHWGALDKELMLQFAEADLDQHYPFGGFMLFLEETHYSTMYLNEHRRAWVTLHA